MLTEAYEEIIQGESLWRFPPDPHHEAICRKLHDALGRVKDAAAARLLAPRSVVQLTPGSLLRPDAALITIATRKLWLVAEIVNPQDHTTDTVTKKNLYEEVNLPRLWMIDPRYDNIEVYYGTPYGLTLKGILAGRDTLTEPLLPGFELGVAELFAS